MNRFEAARFSAFALQVTFWLLRSNYAMTGSLRELGLDPRRVLELAKSKQMIVWEELGQATQKTGTTAGDVIGRIMEATANSIWPPSGESSMSARAGAFVSGLRVGVDRVDTTIAPNP